MTVFTIPCRRCGAPVDVPGDRTLVPEVPLPGHECAPAALLRRAAYVLGAVHGYAHRDIPLPDDVTTGQWARLADTPPELLTTLAAVFERWGRMVGWDLDFLNRIGGPETLATARAVLDGEQR